MVQTHFHIKVIKPGILIRDRFGNILDARSTVTLIRSDDVNVIIDTGLSSERDTILQSLQDLQLTPSNIDFVVNTHSHIDHTGNNDLFFKATFILHQTETTAKAHQLKNISVNSAEKKLPGIIFLETPGHTHGSISLFLTGQMFDHTGTFAITGDALPILDNYLKWVPPGINYSTKVALESMQNIVNRAEFIIPGHDKPFKIINKEKRIAKYLF
jgi:glyoxylase-like metal-dependent hydrolase (beta-lactamase superfamily II)